MDATTDPVNLVDNLDPDALRQRLRELERQQRAVRVLLRAAVAREKKLDRATQGGSVRVA